MLNFIKSNDIVLLHSDMKSREFGCETQEEAYQRANRFLDEITDILTDGTLLIPAFNWDYFNNKGIGVESQTGLLSKVALSFEWQPILQCYVDKANGFCRTNHPVYSFAVWGKNRDEICNIKEKSSFGTNSPFGYIHRNNGKIIILNVDYQDSFTFAHYVEKIIGVDYRFDKDFGQASMYVRKEGILPNLNPMGQILEEEGTVKTYENSYGVFKVMNAWPTFDRIERELKENPEIMITKTDGKQMHELAERLFFVHRSLTGTQTLDILKEYIKDLNIHHIASGTEVFDWTVPDEWIVNEAYIITPDGKKICDYSEHPLHLVGYSQPVDKEIDYEELVEHLHYKSDMPTAIPYVTRYYDKDWDFCLSYSKFKNLKKGRYKVIIDVEHKKGRMSYGDVVLKGKSHREVLLDTYICHPAMANDGLSGIVLLVQLYKWLKEKDRHYTYRFVFAPETIGTIAYLHQQQCNVAYGLVATCVGDEGNFYYQKSRCGGKIDQICEYVLKRNCTDYSIHPFDPNGTDERQYCSSGFNWSVGSLMKSPYGTYPEYHTSLDNLEFVTPDSLNESFEIYKKIIEAIEADRYFITKNPCCEPFRKKHGLWLAENESENSDFKIRQWEWILNYSDGEHTLFDICVLSGMPLPNMEKAAAELKEKDLIKENRI